MIVSGQSLTYVAVGSLIAWRLYARIRRMVGRQRLSRYRAPVTLVVFGGLVLLVALPSLARPERLAWLLLALACGVALGLFGLRQTTFEVIPKQGFFYTPSTRLGIALTLLFVARIAYRVFETLAAPSMPRSAAEFAQSPLTLSVFGLLAGYYIAYAAGLALWRARVLEAKRAREARTPDV
jgi:ABC-type nickel/cobalt efflux system permease component RcnA